MLHFYSIIFHQRLCSTCTSSSDPYLPGRRSRKGTRTCPGNNQDFSLSCNLPIICLDTLLVTFFAIFTDISSPTILSKLVTIRGCDMHHLNKPITAWMQSNQFLLKLDLIVITIISIAISIAITILPSQSSP